MNKESRGYKCLGLSWIAAKSAEQMNYVGVHNESNQIPFFSLYYKPTD